MTFSWVHSISQRQKRSTNRTKPQIRTTLQYRIIRNEKKARGADGSDVSRCTSRPAQAVTISPFDAMAKYRQRTEHASNVTA
jgi:hypothetical protein